ncbi:acetyl-CoA/propionyl-CoA carboxylase, biotin carboxylase, biotin carboxyl carrier protein [Labedella gwakjiensis]|uniref:biotin carboxylase n=1 Tax=Labedella gwakjiensis TaxID=390269 RepID=A0A2P8GU60_9MICO|nr:biotin carboxylase N-terminal domain-containing protein [Labedella gwakjiensis]PSL37499.1 acetyl-CoA/propionyl-CoA carboxylase, biotin carboxylase, biotin carboxyl carrier protein [Labedella gwakjiensis]RUQ84803.1 ATP-grasp domain-containing protein [Labedella gwakjiensis]
MTAHAPRKVLIANRGEIAVRIARACADHGYTSVAVYADGDADALHVRLADEAHGLGGVTGAETYLDADKIIEAARASGATLVHPGYGFLSESADFARAVRDAGLTWVGPSPESIELLGDKISARKLAESVGAPLIAGTTDPVASAAEAIAFAEEHGLPIAIKAAFGGGGRGMRVARRLDEVAELFEAAGREAVAAFGRGECFIERYLERPRHVEAQVLADDHGNVVALGTRDCSLQRRSQKLVEEAPAPFLTDEQRDRVLSSARDICAAADYRGAATVEFLLGADGLLSFLEVNTRLQVEHPVTEETTGVDIVGEQLRIAAGLPLSITETPSVRGHSIEFRINAEDPARGFLPTPGTITTFAPPTGPGVRLDTGVESGSEVSGRFDSMMAKLIVIGVDRDAALARARRALAEFRIEGVASVLPFHRAVLDDADFTAEDGFAVHTQWIETTFADRTPPQSLAEEPAEPDVVSSWIEVDGRRLGLRLPAALAGSFASGVGTASAFAPGATGAAASQDGDVLAPMAGTLVRWAVEDGAAVDQGDTIAVVEAMKMETTVVAPVAGTVRLTDDAPSPGDPVSPTTVLARITAD